MHILIFDIAFQEKVKNYFLFSAIFDYFFTFYPKNPKRPNRQSANMAHFVAFCIGFQKNIPLQNPPGGGEGGIWQLKVYYFMFCIWTIWWVSMLVHHKSSWVRCKQV